MSKSVPVYTLNFSNLTSIGTLEIRKLSPVQGIVGGTTILTQLRFYDRREAGKFSIYFCYSVSCTDSPDMRE